MSAFDKTDVLDHLLFLTEDFGNIYNNDRFSDVTFVVEGEKFHAHKVILAARSKYFSAMLFGGMSESFQEEIELKDVNCTAFKFVLKYIYTGNIAFRYEKTATLVEVFNLAHQYEIGKLEFGICQHLIKSLCEENFVIVYNFAQLYSLFDVHNACTEFINENCLIIVKHPSFKELSKATLTSLLQLDSFGAAEIDIFRAVKYWIQKNDPVETDSLTEILGLIRLTLISSEDLIRIVRSSELFSPMKILDVLQTQIDADNTFCIHRHRGYLYAEKNVAKADLGAVLLTGLVGGTNLISGNTSVNHLTYHNIGTEPNFIAIELDKIYILNHFKLWLYDVDARSNSYYIDVSVDNNRWTRVIDHSEYECRSRQFLCFPNRGIKYIKIVGTKTTVGNIFHVVSFEAYCSKHPSMQHQGIVVPSSNVAVTSTGCAVTGGLNPQFLLDGNSTNFTHHNAGGFITVQLSQPYWFSSLRLQLWDGDDRTYGYYIESSTDGKVWEKIADKSEERCQSWQDIEFAPRIVTYFKIVGVHNSANQEFRCIHFECPASTVPALYPDNFIGTNE